MREKFNHLYLDSHESLITVTHFFLCVENAPLWTLSMTS